MEQTRCARLIVKAQFVTVKMDMFGTQYHQSVKNHQLLIVQQMMNVTQLIHVVKMF